MKQHTFTTGKFSSETVLGQIYFLEDEVPFPTVFMCIVSGKDITITTVQAITIAIGLAFYGHIHRLVVGIVCLPRTAADLVIHI